MENMKICFVIALIGASFSAPGQLEILAPQNIDNTSGAAPFLVITNVAASLRYQQVYDASDFLRVGSPFLITDLRFAGGYRYGSTFIDVDLVNIQLSLSISQRGPDDLSTVFAENVGSDAQVVYSGSLHFWADGRGAFDIHVPLQHPFVYDPSEGNLLLDAKNFMTIRPPPLGERSLLARSALGDNVSAVLGLDVNATEGVAGSFGLITVFNVTPVPEPQTYWLFSLGAFGLCVSRVVRHARGKCRSNI